MCRFAQEQFFFYALRQIAFAHALRNIKDTLLRLTFSFNSTYKRVRDTVADFISGWSALKIVAVLFTGSFIKSLKPRISNSTYVWTVNAAEKFVWKEIWTVQFNSIVSRKYCYEKISFIDDKYSENSRIQIKL